MLTNYKAATGGLFSLMVVVASCGSGDGPAAPINGGSTGGATGPTETTSVSVGDNLFNPNANKVAPGATVTWTWNGGAQHNVTWVGGGLTNSPTQVSGTFQQAMPAAAGEYAYFCTLHGTSTSGMRGRVVVE